MLIYVVAIGVISYLNHNVSWPMVIVAWHFNHLRSLASGTLPTSFRLLMETQLDHLL